LKWLSEAKLRVKNQNLRNFDAKLRFALLASLRSAIFSEAEATINWSLSPQGLKRSFASLFAIFKRF